MKYCCFIIPYFGKLPTYFQLFLNSCKLNPEYEWLLFTDDNTNYVFPINVKKIFCTFTEFRDKIQKKFDFSINLERPYKLCDYKPCYGYVLEEYLKGFIYWGYCDIDTLMGCLNNFLPQIFNEDYDKIFCLGHMSLYKNTRECNELFMKDIDGISYYHDAFTTQKIMYFDEEFKGTHNINHIFNYFNKKIYIEDLSLNFSIFFSQFRRVILRWGYSPLYNIEKPADTLCVWEKGHVFRYRVEGNKLMKEEFPYVHLQSRKMKVRLNINNLLDITLIKIVPNSFRPCEVDSIFTPNDFYNIRRKYFCTHILELWYKSYKRRLISKIKRLLHGNQ